MLSSAVGLLGLTTIIAKAFSYMGILNSPLVAYGIPIFGIAKLVQIKRRGYSLERGSLANEGSYCMFKKQ